MRKLDEFSTEESSKLDLSIRWLSVIMHDNFRYFYDRRDNRKRRNRQNVNALRLISEPVVITRSNRYTSSVAVIFSTRFCNCCP